MSDGGYERGWRAGHAARRERARIVAYLQRRWPGEPIMETLAIALEHRAHWQAWEDKAAEDAFDAAYPPSRLVTPP
jgi:hypothetical protein